jgi:hypothetical protein
MLQLVLAAALFGQCQGNSCSRNNPGPCATGQCSFNNQQFTARQFSAPSNVFDVSQVAFQPQNAATCATGSCNNGGRCSFQANGCTPRGGQNTSASLPAFLPANTLAATSTGNTARVDATTVGLLAASQPADRAWNNWLAGLGQGGGCNSGGCSGGGGGRRRLFRR